MDNFICKICGYSLIIKKTSNTNVVKLSTPTEFLNALKNEELQEYDIVLERADLEKYLNEKKDKKKSSTTEILKSYDDMKAQKRSMTKYGLNCTFCSHPSKLEPGTTIYSLNFKKQQSSFNDNNIDLKLYDPTLPRTKDYICDNPDCETRQSNFDMKNKEAVFYRANGSYHTKYACLNCKHSWLI